MPPRPPPKRQRNSRRQVTLGEVGFMSRLKSYSNNFKFQISNFKSPALRAEAAAHGQMVSSKELPDAQPACAFALEFENAQRLFATSHDQLVWICAQDGAWLPGALRLNFGRPNLQQTRLIVG